MTAPDTTSSTGTPGWQLTHPGPEHAIEGFADRVSVTPGEPVRLFVSTTAPHYTVTAFRIGAYQGSDALSVWTSPPQTGSQQPGAVVQEPTRTVVAPWTPSLTVDTAGWAPGNYLLRLDADSGAQQYVPLTVKTPSNAGRLVVINAVTTWQAYNQWGGYSLYKGPDGRRETRSRAVSFDRPYQQAMSGAGQFLQFELAAVLVAEHAGIPLGYATDVDLDADPHLLDGARAVLTLGHDEYWSTAMREAATAARDRGVNLAFLGGNEVYRHIRFAATPLGENRLEINYKSFGEDPASRTDPKEATPDWRQPPYPRPESVLTGNYYSCFPGRADLVATNPDNWLLQGIVGAGEKLTGPRADQEGHEAATAWTGHHAAWQAGRAGRQEVLGWNSVSISAPPTPWSATSATESSTTNPRSCSCIGAVSDGSGSSPSGERRRSCSAGRRRVTSQFGRFTTAWSRIWRSPGCTCARSCEESARGRGRARSVPSSVRPSGRPRWNAARSSRPQRKRASAP